MSQSRYTKGELVRIRPWPHMCPDCKGKPVQVLHTGDRVPFTSRFVAMVPDKVGRECHWVIQCDLCHGTGTVFK